MEDELTRVHQNTILRRFWHRTRRTIVPLTKTEIIRAMAHDEDQVSATLRALHRMGYVVSDYHNIGRENVYDLTEAGRTALMALILEGAGT